MLLMAKYGN
jgi:hypothetical protein